jgi:hypothetical protein
VYKLDNTALQIAIVANVSAALAEDVASGDINALLIPESQTAFDKNYYTSRCGSLWNSLGRRSLPTN